MHAQRHWKLMLATGLALTGLMATATGASTPPPADPPQIAGIGAPAQNADFFDDLLNGLIGHNGDHDSNGGHDDCGSALTNTSDGNASASATLPFPVNYFGARGTGPLYVNNDGTVNFGPTAQGGFPGTTLTALTKPTIAPFLADAAAGSYYPPTGKVSYGSVRDGNAFCVRWEDMTPASGGNAKNTFSLLLRKTNTPGDFDLDFRYNHIAWDLGKPTDSAASVGLTAGTGAANTYFVLPGSQTTGAFVDGGPNELRSTEPTIQSGSFLFHVVGGVPTPIGAAPMFTANPTNLTTAEDTPLSFNLSTVATDTDPGDAVQYKSATNPAHGTVSCTNTPTPKCTYTPNADFNSPDPDQFSLTVKDMHGNSTTGLVKVTVTPVNDAPKVTNKTVLMHLPLAPLMFNVLTGATDLENNTLAVTAPVVATATTRGNVTCATNGDCTYTPNTVGTILSAANPTDSFPFTVTDNGTTGSTPAADPRTAAGTVTITLHNDPPVASFTTSVPSQPVTASAGNNPGPNLTVVFNPTVSDPDGPTTALQCRWVFGDGTTEPAAANTFGPCAVIQHTYAQAGTYTVALTVTDGTDSTTVLRKLEVGRDDHRPPYNNGPGSGNNGPGGGNNGPGQGPGGGPRDHAPGRGPDDHGRGDHGRGDFGPGDGRHHGGDHLELVNDGHPSYAVHGTLDHGDFRIERDGGEIRWISGTGYFGDGSSVTFRLRVHHGLAFGTITVRDRDHVLDRFRMRGVRILHHGDTVAARTRYDGGDGRLSFVIEDRD